MVCTNVFMAKCVVSAANVYDAVKKMIDFEKEIKLC